MVLAAASPPQEKAERSGKRGFGAATPDCRAEVSEVHKFTQPLLAAASPPQEKAERRGAERSGKRGFGGGSPRLPPNRAAEVSEVHDDYRAEVSEVHKQLIGSVKH